MKATSSDRTILFSLVILLVLPFILICSFFTQDWYVDSTTITSVQLFHLFHNGGDFPWTMTNTIRFKTTDDPLVVQQKFCAQRGWSFHANRSCQYSYLVDLGPSFYMIVSKTVMYWRTTPPYMTLSEAYTLHKREP